MGQFFSDNVEKALQYIYYETRAMPGMVRRDSSC